MIAHSKNSTHNILNNSTECCELISGKSVFLATPMSGFASDTEYQGHRNLILKLIDFLQKKYKLLDVYYAGKEIESTSDFSDNSSIALDADLKALIESDVFVLVLPKKMHSSVLVEAGYAMAKMIPMILMVNSRDDLPYFFKEAQAQKVHTESELVPFIEIREYGDNGNLIFQLDEIVQSMFSESIVFSQ